jgi:hypothetical protein
MEVGVMPKEIAFSDREFVQLPDGGEVPVTDDLMGKGHQIMRRGAIVRWSRDHMLVELGVAKIEVSAHSETDGHYLTLDRTATNRLIRSLRKARDQAFGADA